MWKYNIRHQLNEDCLLWKYSFERWQWLAFWTERENIVWAECAPMSTSLTGNIMPQAFWSRLPCCIVYILPDFFWKWQEQPDLWHVEGFSCKSISIVWFCNRLLFIWELAQAVSRTKFGTSVNFLFRWLIDTDTRTCQPEFTFWRVCQLWFCHSLQSQSCCWLWDWKLLNPGSVA